MMELHPVSIVMIPGNKGNVAFEFLPVLQSGQRFCSISQISQIIHAVCGRNGIIPVFYQHMIHFPDIGKEERT